MKKQIAYPKFIPRLFSMTIDLVILSIVLTPVMNIIYRYVFIYELIAGLNFYEIKPL